jgi:hypothetical protein
MGNKFLMGLGEGGKTMKGVQDLQRSQRSQDSRDRKGFKNRIAVGLLTIATGALLAIGPQTLFKICDQGHHEGHSACFWTGQATIGIGIVLIALGVLYLVVSDPGIRVGLSVGIAASLVLAFLVANVLIGVDDDAMMPCHTTTLPALNVISVLSFALAALNTGFLLRLVRIRTAETAQALQTLQELQAAQATQATQAVHEG